MSSRPQSTENDQEIDQKPASLVESENVLKPREVDIQNAKSFLLRPSEKTGVSMYDFLVLVIRRIYEEKDSGKKVNIEDVCRRVKRDLYRHKPSTIKKVEPTSAQVKLAYKEKTLFASRSCPSKPRLDDEDPDDLMLTKLPNLLQTMFYWEQAGVGLNREEVVRVLLGLKTLLQQVEQAGAQVDSVRFWGKIFGRDRDYYVAEIDGVVEAEVPPVKAVPVASEKEEKPVIEDEEQEIVDEPPKSEWKALPLVLEEEPGQGVNRKTYFVCNELGDKWTRLPDATPEQVVKSRLIKKIMTGNLDAEVVSYPPFPSGCTEAHYLRAIIARISASTHISPSGFYTLDEEAEEAEEEDGGAGNSRIIEDPEWEPIPLADLTSDDLGNWAHHTEYILPQGRTKWWNPATKTNETGEEGEEDEDEEQEEEMDEPEPEQGPPILTIINEDEGGAAAWNVRKSSDLIAEYGVALISSNRWPGAHAFATDRTFDNIYIGWGDKQTEPNLFPPAPEPILEEFPSGEEITEKEDPTPDEEAAFRAQQAQAAEQAEENAEENEEEEGEEEEEEEDD